jgi:hypothetical protein
VFAHTSHCPPGTDKRTLQEHFSVVMPGYILVYRLEFDPKCLVVRCAFENDVTEADLFDADRELTRFTEETRTEGAIYDFSDVGQFRVSAEAMQKLATLKSPGLAGKQRVVVAPQPVIFGLCRIFQSMRDSAGDNLVAVVKTFPEALGMLGVKGLQFRRVELS